MSASSGDSGSAISMPIRRDATVQRDRIVHSALTVLGRDGITGFSLRAVAKEAGCTIGLINHWFESKDDLVTAAWREAATRIERRAQRSPQLGPERAGRLGRNALALTPAARLDHRVWQAFAALTIGNPGLEKVHADFHSAARARLAGTLRQLGHPSNSAEETAALVIAAVDGIIGNALIDPAYWTPARQERALRRMVGPLLRPPADARRP